jgi:hypothetical protein
MRTSSWEKGNGRTQEGIRCANVFARYRHVVIVVESEVVGVWWLLRFSDDARGFGRIAITPSVIVP